MASCWTRAWRVAPGVLLPEAGRALDGGEQGRDRAGRRTGHTSATLRPSPGFVNDTEQPTQPERHLYPLRRTSTGVIGVVSLSGR
jgi:hypothetical protein